MGRLVELHRYPLKSGRGESLDAVDVEPWGLAGDRRWMVVDPENPGQLAITAREVNSLLLVGAQAREDGGLRLTAPGVTGLDVAPPDAHRQEPVGLWRSRLTAAPAPDADGWLTAVLGRPARLVWLDDPRRRPTNPTYSRVGDRVSFADGYPLLLATEESLAALNDVVLGASAHPREPLPMTRFRPNVVVTGATAWAEDDWRRLRIGDVVFRAVKGCARCVMTTVDPETAVREREPIASLARMRRWDGATWFGVNLIPDDPQRVHRLRLGDDVEILEAVEPGGGPLR
ncbi:MOSC domain-containing protein [Nocardioides sp. R-C-SC26]|uniref:MOSC domain-containing protein n=1 Tax=Nocardioides sp. R-C-SC26 TaxID=2870414 RepID=UPI001E37B640|nr:MOSC N-terminal beta barrel domain-containing protein [Nocardioides sp. R-C-SC26]